MKNILNTLLLASCLASLTSGNALARDKSSANFGTKLTVGIENDSNVAVEELDRDSRDGDSLLSLGLNLDYENKLDDNGKLSLGYAYSSDSYDQFDQFDLSTQFLSANYSHKLDQYTLGGSARYIVSDLASEKFLTLGQASFNVSRLLNKTQFLRVDYTYTDKELDRFTGRNSTKHGLGADLYFFLEGSKRYFTVGYKYEDEDADSDEFDRSIQSLKASYTQKFSLLGRDTKGRINARYQTRDYDAITPSIGQVRDDKRLRLSADLQMDLTENWFVLLEYEFSDAQSNLPAADLDQNIVAVKFGWQMERDLD